MSRAVRVTSCSKECWVFVSFCVVLSGPLVEVTPVVGGSRVPGWGWCRRF
jgi:hypothetical protein